MPELPEVETIRRGLSEVLIGRQLANIADLESPKSLQSSPADIRQFVVGAKVKAVRRRAKLLMIDLDSGYSLLVHLKMTGQLVFRLPVATLSPPKSPETASLRVPAKYAAAETRVADVSGDLVARAFDCEPAKSPETAQSFGGGHPTDSLIGKLPDRSTRVRVDFEDGSTLFFNDQRRFGWVKVLPSLEISELEFFKKVGPESLEPTTTSDSFIQRVRRRNRSMIKPVILDQSVIAGVGNIYADESLWLAKIHPETRAEQLSDGQLTELFQAVIEALELSLAHGGSTDRNYLNARGEKGSYLQFASVFRREGQACRLHPDQEILKIKVGGRGTHYCPVCQVRVGR